jgi:hypothetical protein
MRSHLLDDRVGCQFKSDWLSARVFQGHHECSRLEFDNLDVTSREGERPAVERLFHHKVIRTKGNMRPSFRVPTKCTVS